MAKNVGKLANAVGATVVGKIPHTGGGAFGAARMAALLQARLKPQVGVRPGRPSDPAWTLSRKVPMSAETLQQLQDLATQLSSEKRKVSPMQVAAQLLEQTLGHSRT
jgi:hypothetical protein